MWVSHCVIARVPVPVRPSTPPTGSDLPAWTVARTAATCATLPQRADVGHVWDVMAGQSVRRSGWGLGLREKQKQERSCPVSGVGAEFGGGQVKEPQPWQVLGRAFAAGGAVRPRVWGRVPEKVKPLSSRTPCVALLLEDGIQWAAANAPAVGGFSSGLQSRLRVSTGRGCMPALPAPTPPTLGAHPFYPRCPPLLP